MLDIGIFISLASFSILLATSNLFGDSEKIKLQQKELEAKDIEKLSKKDRQELTYFRWNHRMRVIGLYSLVVGLLIILLSKLS